ncbi:two-component system response regulator NarL [Pseudomonas graminis]
MTTQLTQLLSTKPASVLLIDDHPMIRNGLKQLIGLDSRLCVVGEASNGADGVALAEQLEADLILLDLNMPGMNGLETLEQLRAIDACGHIVVFSVSDYEDDVINALKRGADGYLLKDMEPESLLECLHRAAAGELVLSNTLPSLLAASLRQQRAPPLAAKPDFTTRERDVLRLIAQGMSNKLIARRLGISESTVKVHVKHLLKKLNMKSRVEAAVWALQYGEV